MEWSVSYSECLLIPDTPATYDSNAKTASKQLIATRSVPIMTNKASIFFRATNSSTVYSLAYITSTGGGRLPDKIGNSIPSSLLQFDNTQKCNVSGICKSHWRLKSQKETANASGREGETAGLFCFVFFFFVFFCYLNWTDVESSRFRRRSRDGSHSFVVHWGRWTTMMLRGKQKSRGKVNIARDQSFKTCYRK